VQFAAVWQTGLVPAGQVALHVLAIIAPAAGMQHVSPEGQSALAWQARQVICPPAPPARHDG
jgi:hypothetical protein